jgi:hypothetical protein
VCSQAKCRRHGAAAKASLNRAIELHTVDANPGELAMARMKSQ